MKFVFKKINLLFLILGLLVCLAGYIIMSTGDKTTSPILLVIAYAVIFPVSILIGTKQKSE